MRVLVPYVGERDGRVEEALWQADAAAAFVCVLEWCDVSRSDTAYAELVADAWQAGESFAVVEHDILVGVGSLRGFAGCPHPYCAHAYQVGEAIRPALGCTRFSGRLLADYPDAMQRVLRVPTSWGAPGHWRQLDVVLQRTVLLNRYGLQPHLHWPSVEHVSVPVRPGAAVLARIPSRPALPELGSADTAGIVKRR